MAEFDNGLPPTGIDPTDYRVSSFGVKQSTPEAENEITLQSFGIANNPLENTEIEDAVINSMGVNVKKTKKSLKDDENPNNIFLNLSIGNMGVKLSENAGDNFSMFL